MDRMRTKDEERALLEAIRRTLRRRRPWMSTLSPLQLTFSAAHHGDRVFGGDRLVAPADEPVPVRLVLRRAPGCLAQILGVDRILAGGVTGARGSLRLTTWVRPADSSFVRAEVRRLEGASVTPLASAPRAAVLALSTPILLVPGETRAAA